MGRSWRREGQRPETLQRLLQLLAQGSEVAGKGRLAANQHVIEIGTSLARDDHTGDFPQAAADPVAGDRIADFAADGKSHPDEGLGPVRRGNLENETGHGTAASGLDTQKVSTVRQTPEARRGQVY